MTLMIPHVRNGRLQPTPTDPVQARKRAMYLAAECAKIQTHLDDRYRREQRFSPTPEGDEAYTEWRQRAGHALRMRNMELRLLNEWLEEQSLGMLRKARELFLQLRNEDVEFDDEEIAFIDALGAFTEEVNYVPHL